MERELILRIIIVNSPPGVDFGLQKGKGTDFETIQLQRSGQAEIRFEFSVTVRNNAKSVPDFFGPLVQGPSLARFIYIDIGTYAGQNNTGISRRLKVPLYSIDKETMKHLLMNKDVILETWIEGTAKDGGPTCGTVKPFNGWKIIAP